MDRLRLDSLKIILLKEMIKELFPDYKYFRIGRNRIVTLRDSFWKLWTTIKVSVFELCMLDIPRALTELNKYHHELYKKSGLHHYVHDYVKIVTTMLVLNYNKDVIQYLWEEFIKTIDPFSDTKNLEGLRTVEKYQKDLPDSVILLKDVKFKQNNSETDNIIKLFSSRNNRQIISSVKHINKLIIKNKKLKLKCNNKAVIYNSSPYKKITLYDI